MAMTIKTEGLTELSQMLTTLEDKAQDVASGSLYEGAGVVGDAFSSAINGIQTEPFHWAKYGETRKPSPDEKAALIGKSGIAKFNKNGGEVDTLIGITGNAGYAMVGKKLKPVRMIARSINSGTSFMQKQPVFRRAASQSQGKAKAAIVSKADEMFNEIINSK